MPVPPTSARWKRAASTSCCASGRGGVMSQPVYLSADIRRIEQAAGDAPLMERAGAAAAALAITLCSDKTKDVVVLAGPGNNGGDAKIVARILQENFFRVSLSAKDVPEKTPG